MHILRLAWEEKSQAKKFKGSHHLLITFLTTWTHNWVLQLITWRQPLYNYIYQKSRSSKPMTCFCRYFLGAIVLFASSRHFVFHSLLLFWISQPVGIINLSFGVKFNKNLVTYSLFSWENSSNSKILKIKFLAIF